MKHVKIIFFQVVILTITSFLLRTISISFRIFLSRQLGTTGMGLYQLVVSVYLLAITFSTSGIRLTATRLAAEELALGRGAEAKKAMKYCLLYALCFSGFVSAVLYLGSNYIGNIWLGDTRTVLSLRLFACGLPMLATSSVFSGYFIAVRQAVKAASVQIADQLVRIGVTASIIGICLPMGLEYACASVVIGSLSGEFCSFLLLLFLYRMDIRRYRYGAAVPSHLLPRMLKIALPVAFGSYVTSGIHTLQQILIPAGLKKSGASSDTALSTYGVIHGMVMPVLMFPSALLNAVSDLIVPELAQCRAKGLHLRRNYIITRVLNFSMLASVCVMCLFFRFSNELGMAIYKNADAALYIRILSPVIPIMYLDRIVDSMHKGMGEQISSMRYNIAESVLSLGLIYFLLPEYAILGYLIAIYTGRILNFGLSLHRLIHVTKLQVPILPILKSLLCIFLAIVLIDMLYFIGSRLLPGYGGGNVVHISITALLGFLLLRLTSCITKDDIQWFYSIFRA